MACCGRNRPVQQAENSSTTHVMPAPRWSSTQYFEYHGKTGLTVLGPITGRRYRFERPGMLLAIDGRDCPSMAGVPNLRRAPAPK